MGALQGEYGKSGAGFGGVFEIAHFQAGLSIFVQGKL